MGKDWQCRVKANLFVSSFPNDWTSHALKLLFEDYGTIIECKVLRTRDGVSKRCGFVRFEKETEALDAIAHLNSKKLLGRKKRLRVKIADRERYQQRNKKMSSMPLPQRLDADDNIDGRRNKYTMRISRNFFQEHYYGGHYS